MRCRGEAGWGTAQLGYAYSMGTLRVEAGSAVDHDGLTLDHVREIAGEKQNCACHVVGRDVPLAGQRSPGPLLQYDLDPGQGSQRSGVDHSGAHAVDVDAARSELERRMTRHRF